MAYRMMTPEVRFFYDHAGYAYDARNGETREHGRRRCAESLARAEIEADRRGWYTDWSDDFDASACYATCDNPGPHTHEVLCAVLYDAGACRSRVAGVTRGRVLARLGGIYDPDRTYARIVAAELALEALAEHEARTGAPAWFTLLG